MQQGLGKTDLDSYESPSNGLFPRGTVSRVREISEDDILKQQIQNANSHH